MRAKRALKLETELEIGRDFGCLNCRDEKAHYSRMITEQKEGITLREREEQTRNESVPREKRRIFSFFGNGNLIRVAKCYESLCAVKIYSKGISP